MANAIKDTGTKVNDLADFESRLVRHILRMVDRSDEEESQRRAADRIGGNLYIGKHWNIPIPARRAAITANVTKALIDHKIAIMTKQDPIPVVEPDDVGDVNAANLMRSALQRWWRKDKMRLKIRRGLKLANTTRTIIGKIRWDKTKNNGAGDVTCDIIPGWRAILDPRYSLLEQMQFVGDRTVMTRSDALVHFARRPEIVERLRSHGELSNNVFTGGTSSSPLRSAFSGASTVQTYAGNAGTIINGKSVLTAQTQRPAHAGKPSDDIELIELYYRDRTLVRKQVPVKDGHGNPIMRIKLGPDNAPMFEQNGDYDDILEEPGFTIAMEPVMREELVPKYPSYRRTVVLAPDNLLILDEAWDGPLPYGIYNDCEPLDGPWAKGSALDLEDLQASLNVSLSTMMDNLRFSSYRAFKATSTAQIEKNNLVLSPGEIIRVGTDINGLQPIEFPQLSAEWFNWLNNLIALMERIIGASGIMQGNASEAPRTDSSAGFDTLAEIGGSRLVESTQRLETFIADLNRVVGWFMQRYYTEAHAIKVETETGELTWERASSAMLMGTFSYEIAVGSTLAWNQSGIRRRLLEDMQSGLRDKVSVWKHPSIGIEDWQAIKKRMETQPPQLNPPPPKRTRQQVPTQKRGPQGHPHQ